MTDRIASRLASQLIERASAEGLTLSTAESCTGGMVSAALTSVSGSSAAFTFGFVTYANEAKMEMLGVDAETLDSHGAVSRQVAAEMAAGARDRAGTDLAVSITGIAGPGGGSEAKPVGLVWFGLATPSGIKTERRVFANAPRELVRVRATHHALRLLHRGADATLRPLF